MKERLQKLISAAGLASRRQAEEWIKAGRVTVNGASAVLGQSADTETDEICVDAQPLRAAQEPFCLMLHKPRGVVTTLSDEKGRPTVADLVRDCGRRVYPVGRLDMDSDGLLLMTNDGALTNLLTHPKHAVPKTYRTEVRGDVDAALPKLCTPMKIDGVTVLADDVKQLSDRLLEITIHEGRNRQVRKMCDAAGLRVTRLTRISEGPLTLGDLPSGKWRALSQDEISLLKSII